MRKYVTVVLCLLAIVACQPKEEAGNGSSTSSTARTKPTDARNAKVDTVIHKEPEFIDRALLGSELGTDGAVAKETTSFTSGQPVYLTLVLRQSPSGLQTGVQWLEAGNKVLQAEKKPMNGTKVATFRFDSRKAKPGHYHVIGYWGGNIAAEKDFEIVAATKAKRKKG